MRWRSPALERAGERLVVHPGSDGREKEGGLEAWLDQFGRRELGWHDRRRALGARPARPASAPSSAAPSSAEALTGRCSRDYAASSRRSSRATTCSQSEASSSRWPRRAQRSRAKPNGAAEVQVGLVVDASAMAGNLGRDRAEEPPDHEDDEDDDNDGGQGREEGGVMDCHVSSLPARELFGHLARCHRVCGRLAEPVDHAVWAAAAGLRREWASLRQGTNRGRIPARAVRSLPVWGS